MRQGDSLREGWSLSLWEEHASRRTHWRSGRTPVVGQAVTQKGDGRTQAAGLRTKDGREPEGDEEPERDGQRRDARAPARPDAGGGLCSSRDAFFRDSWKRPLPTLLCRHPFPPKTPRTALRSRHGGPCQGDMACTLAAATDGRLPGISAGGQPNQSSSQGAHRQRQ